ncbi:MAG: two-component system, OmpR family, sensor kinase [Gaiellales bacterium]|jgi:two-component system OmpR family sensor kinase|nr:two-component system, OmpR family, sensor kinase [Gaiellales bacterium]
MRRLSSMPLRVRLVLISVALLATALLIAGVATRLALENFLIDRVDEQFQTSLRPVLIALGDPHDPRAQDQAQGALPPGSYAALITPGGTVEKPFFRGDVPASLSELAREAPTGPSTIDGYRVQTFAGSEGSRLVMAIPLSDVHSTLDRLALLELLIGAIVLAAVAVIAYLVVRRELRPLRRIEDTAAAIAAGDLSRRVENADPATEVGSLGRSLNAMLAQIEEAFEERRRSEDRLRRFVADASHELRTPLTSVRGFAELFRRGAAERPDDLAVAMRRIEAEAERMGVLVEDLLLLAKLDQGRPLEREPVNMGGMLEELVADHRMLHPEWPIELQAAAGGDLVGDDLRLRQAVANLLSNARSHTPPGTPIRVSLAPDGDGAMAIEVADEGPGIAPADLGRVFERFYRADPSRARRNGGAGLGLSIVEAIARAHGGRAEVESHEGGGAVFRLVLPNATGLAAGDATSPVGA